MKITPKILSIPPYISTTWDQVTSLRVVEKSLFISLKDGCQCTILDLPKELIDQIFSFHAADMEKPPVRMAEENPFIHGLQTGFKELVGALSKLGTSAFASLSKVAEHDPKTANLPDLPPEMIEKVRLLHQVLSREDVASMAPPENGCNCMYCQIIRILKEPYSEQHHEAEAEKELEKVEEKDLEFSEWIIEPLGEQLYKVTNKLDHHGEYRVFLGNPIGCTCGKQNCEHILAVLKS
jgi:hypothetical protein